MEITRTNVLAIIRRCSEYKNLASSTDERLLLRAGILPRIVLLQIFGASSADSKKGREIESLLEQLLVRGRIKVSSSYIRAEPRDRIRPVYSNFDIEKPTNLPPRSQIRPTLSRRDRLALWYAAANHNLSGSQNDTTAIFLLLQFWRRPNIQKAWRRYLSTISTPYYKGKLPEDAK
jgi:hypothetical protein